MGRAGPSGRVAHY